MFSISRGAKKQKKEFKYRTTAVRRPHGDRSESKGSDLAEKSDFPYFV
jgi:hypothetical protein